MREGILQLTEIYHVIEANFKTIVNLFVLFMEAAGLVIIVLTTVRSLIEYFKHHDDIRIRLGQGIMLGLEFKLGGEVLKSVVVNDWNELGRLAAIILIRAALTLLLHWEIKSEEKEHLEHLRQQAEITRLERGEGN